MSEEVTKPVDPTQDSSILGVSVRGWLAVMLVGTVCAIHAGVIVAQIYLSAKTNTLPDWSGNIVGEPLYSMGMTALGFYLGQKSKSL